MAYQNAKQSGKPGSKTKQAPRPSSVTIAAKGDAPTIGNRTPAPTRVYKNPKLTERSAPAGYGRSKNLGPSSSEPDGNDPSGYGQAKNPGPSSIPPGAGEGDSVSDLGQELKRVAAESDAGDLLQDVIERGTARDSTVALQSSETRDLADKSEGNRDAAPVHPAFKRQTTPSKVGDVAVGDLPATCGASAAPAPVDPFAKG